MTIYLSNSGRRGDDEDEQLARRYAELREVAAENGLLDKLRSVEVPTPVKSAYGALVDIVQREESAVAGVLDVLQGTAGTRDTVGGRVIRELFGDTKLGNALGVAAPSRELYGDVLEQGGMGEGGKLSDLIGDDWAVTKYFDPTMRDTAALGLAVLTSPSTYLTAGAGKAAVRAIGKAGAINLGPKGMKLVEQVYKSKLSLRAQKAGLELTDDFAELEGRYLSRVAKRSGMKALDERRAMDLQSALYREAQGEVADYVIKTGARGMTDPYAIRFAGVPIVPLDPVGRMGQAMWAAAKDSRIGPLANLLAKGGSLADKAFQRVPFGARKHEAFKMDEYLAHSMKSSSEQVAREMVYGEKSGFMSKRLRKALSKNLDANKLLARYVESGAQDKTLLAQAADLIKADPDELSNMVDDAIRHLNGVGNDAVRGDVLGIDAFAKWFGRYVPRVLKHEYRDRGKAAGKYAFSGGDIGTYGMARHHDTLEHFVEAVRLDGLDPDKAIEWSFEKLLVDYTAMHIKAMADVGLARDTVSKFGLDSREVLGGLLDGLKAAGRELTDRDTEDIADLLLRNKFVQHKATVRKNTLARAAELRSEMPYHKVYDEYTREIEDLSKELDDLRSDRLVAEAKKDLVRAQKAHRSQEIAELSGEKAGVLAEARLFRKLRNSLKDEIRTVKRNAVQNKDIADAKVKARDMRKALKQIRKNKDFKSFATMPLKEQISRTVLKVRGLERELDALLANPRRNLDKAVDRLAELDELRGAINTDIEFWKTSRTLSQVELQEALDTVRLAKDRIKEQRSIIGRVRANRAALKEGRAQEVVYPRNVREDDMAKVMAMDPAKRAAYLYRAAENVESLEELDIFLNLHREMLYDLPESAIGPIRRAAHTKAVQGHREVVFDKGPLRGQAHLLPEGIADFLERNQASLGSRLPDELQPLLRGYDMLTNAFKLTHTVFFPGFHVRNLISNVSAVAVSTNILAQMDGGLVRDTIKAMTGHGEFTMVSRSGRRYTSQQLRNHMVALDVIPDRMRTMELVSGGETFLDRVRALKVAASVGGEAGQRIENFSRGLYFMDLVRSGVDPVQASRRVKEVLFDYGDLSFTQREVIRRVVPFATWTMKNVELQVKNLARRTGPLATTIRLADSGERGPEADLLPEYMRGEMKTQLLRENGRTVFLAGLDLPITNINVLWAGGIGETLKANFNTVTPMLKNPMEYAIGMDTFSNQSIKGRKWLGTMGPKMERALPKWAKEYLEFEVIEASNGKTYYQANGTKMWSLTKNIVLGRLFNESVRAVAMAKEIADGDIDEGMVSLWRLTSGLRLDDIQIDAGQRRELQRKVREIEDYLLEKGLIREFKRRYIPKDEQQTGSGSGRTGLAAFNATTGR